MAQTSIHIRPVKGGSELHNERRKVLDYVRPELSKNNQTWKSPDFPGIDEQAAKINSDYQTAHSKKMHAKATPIREAVVVIQKDTTMQQLLNACAKCREKFGIEVMQIYTHKDEGHTAEDGSWKPNLHAHIVFNWYSSDTHTTHKLSRQDMSEMQTLFAECLSMERGVSSDRKHLNAIQQKNEAEAAKLQRLQEQVQQQTAQHKAELEQECKDLRQSGTGTVKAFDYLCGFDAVKPTDKQRAFRDNLEQECHRDLPTETTALFQHAQVLRYNLMNTIDAVRAIGQRLQKLASHIPFFKRRRLAHESDLQSAVENANIKAENAVNSAKEAIWQARTEQSAAEAAKDAAKLKERELKKKLLTLQNDIEQAHKSGYDAGTKSLQEKVDNLEKTKANWLEDFRTISRKLTSLNAESVALLEEMGLRDAVGQDIWDNAKKQQHRETLSPQQKPRGPHF